MSLIKQISLKNTTYDIAADAQNISYGSNSNVKSKLDTLTKGAANGVAELDANGKVPTSQLPSYVDDVVDGYYNTTDHKFYAESTYITEISGEEGKIYISLDTNITYRWGGSTAGFVAIGSDLALGETSSSAYRGDRGKTAYDHSQDSGKVSSAITSGLYKVAATAEGHIADLTAVIKSDITGLGIPAQDTTYGAPTTSAAGLVPALPSDGLTTKFLRQDGSQATPTLPFDVFALTETMAANATSVTFTNNKLGTNTIVLAPMTSTGIMPLSVNYSDANHTYTATFAAQSSAVDVTILCFNFS